MAKLNKGQFKKGNPGGPGRPRRQVEQEYVNAVMASCSLADWKRIVKAAVKDAVAGDGKAREWLAKYLAPVPERHEHTGPGGGPIESRDVSGTLANAQRVVAEMSKHEREQLRKELIRKRD